MSLSNLIFEIPITSAMEPLAIAQLALHKKMKFSITYFLHILRIFTFTEEILYGKIHFLCSVVYFRRKAVNIKLKDSTLLLNALNLCCLI